MEDGLVHPSEPENPLGVVRLQAGQCWRLQKAIPPFADLVVLLNPVRSAAGPIFWEVILPLADRADRLLQWIASSGGLWESPVGSWERRATREEPIQRPTENPPGTRPGEECVFVEEEPSPPPPETPPGLPTPTSEYARPGEPAEGIRIQVREEVLRASLRQFMAEGLAPSDVRRCIRTHQHGYFILGPLEEALREVPPGLLWEPDMRRFPSPENFLQALQQADTEALLQMLQQEPTLLEQLLPRPPGEADFVWPRPPGEADLGGPLQDGQEANDSRAASEGQMPYPTEPAGQSTIPGQPRVLGESSIPGQARVLRESSMPGASRLSGEPSMSGQPSMPPAPALCWAVRLGAAELVKILLEMGANVHASDTAGNTPLHWAARLGQLEIARILLEHGADGSRKNQAGETALLVAARSAAWDGPRIAQLLLDAGAEADLNSLVALGRVEQVQTILQAPAQALADAPQPDRLLDDALWAIQRAIARRMDPAITDPETLDAVMAEYLPMLEGLLQAGVDPNADFPLWRAVQLPDPRPAALLLQWGADPNRKIHENMFPLEVARTPAIRDLLRRHGAKHPDDPDLVVQRETERLAHWPEDTEALRRRAEAWARLGRLDQALADWAAFSQLEPESPEGYLGQAWIWASCPDDRFRDGPSALRAAQRAVELAGGWESLIHQRVWNAETGQVSVRTEYWLTYAAALAELGRFDEAVQVLDQVLLICSAADRPRIRYVRSLFLAGQPYRARPAEQEDILYQQFTEESPPPGGIFARLKTWWSRLMGRLWPKGDTEGEKPL
jgi:tetratricopeptide (TPR) repeat protein